MFGTIITGNSSSSTVTVCTQVLVLPDSSVTIQLTTVVPTENDDGASLVTIKSEANEQLSDTEGVPSETVVSQSPSPSLDDPTIISSGQVISGALVSTSVMVCKQVLLFPLVSVTVHVRSITEAFPDPGITTSECETVRLLLLVSQLSVAVALPNAVTEVSASHSNVTSDGQTIAGPVVSTTSII